MKIGMFLVLVAFIPTAFSFAQTDSIVTYSNLKFHSEFEKRAFNNLVRLHTDTLDAFLAVDESMDLRTLENVHQSFSDILKELDSKKIEKKKTKAKVTLIFNTVKNKHLGTYDQDGTVTSTLLNGRYNEWTVTPIVAMLLDIHQVPYKIMYSMDQLRLVANPGPEEMDLSANNPSPIMMQYPFDYRKKYMDYLCRTGVISDAELRLRGINELFEEHSKKEKLLSIAELIGLKYFVTAQKKSKLRDYSACLIPAQKAFYLYSSPEILIVLLNGLSDRMNRFTVNESADIDYLIQYYRASGIDAAKTNAYFSQVVSKLLQNPEKIPLCDSIYQQLTLQIKDQKVIDEIGYTYNILRINQKKLSYPDMFFADKAAYFKPDNKELSDYTEYVIENYLKKIVDKQILSDSLASLSTKFKSQRALETLQAKRLVLLLTMAKEAYQNKEHADGEKFLQAFESSCLTPVKNASLLHSIELAFYDLAVTVYWGNKQDYAANAKMIQRGLKYAPESELIKSGAYEKKNDQVTSKKKKEKVYDFQ